MNTILTDDERPKLPPTNTVPRDYFTTEQMEAYADAREAAVLAKLAQQEPYGQVTVVRNPGCVEQHWFYRWPEPPYLDNAAECYVVYTHPAPQQADRQRVPDGWRETMLAAQQALHRAALPMTNSADMQKIHAALHQVNELLAAAPEAPAQEIADVWHEGSRSFYRAVLLKKLALDEVFFDPAGSPEAPAQASAVDERDRKDAERYRFVRDADRSDKLVPFDTLLSYARESLDEAIDEAMEREARAALAHKGD